MFAHNFRYTLKYLLKNRMLIFWTYAFPVILGLLFYLAFSNIEKDEKLQVIPIALVKEEAGQAAGQGENPAGEILEETVKSLSKENDPDRLFDMEYVTESKAKKLLDQDKIRGYLLLGKEPQVVVRENGTEQTIFQQVISQILQQARLSQAVTDSPAMQKALSGISSPEEARERAEKVLEGLKQENPNIQDRSGDHLGYTVIEYYTLIAMACLYSATIGMYAVNSMLANMSRKGMRISVSPAGKGRLIFSGVCASYVVQLLGLGILFAFLVFGLKVDFGRQILPVLFLALTGSFCGLCVGIAVGALVKASENTKIGVIISVTMLGCFLSGMMGITMKYLVDKNIPLLNRINPAAMITDGFYALYYYDTLNRYWLNIGSLLLFSLLMILLSVWSLKRQTYKSL